MNLAPLYLCPCACRTQEEDSGGRVVVGAAAAHPQSGVMVSPPPLVCFLISGYKS